MKSVSISNHKVPRVGNVTVLFEEFEHPGMSMRLCSFSYAWRTDGSSLDAEELTLVGAFLRARGFTNL